MLFRLALARLVRHGTLTVRYPDGTERRVGDGTGLAPRQDTLPLTRDSMGVAGARINLIG